jgi:hypothetical protein
MDGILGAFLLGADTAGQDALMRAGEVRAGRQISLVSQDNLGVPDGVLSGSGAMGRTARPQTNDSKGARHDSRAVAASIRITHPTGI